jgi:1,4-alpha-glucan branching enzyme
MFDYWGVPSLQRWMNDGKFDGGQLTEQEKSLRSFYTRLLTFSANNPALRGEFADLHKYNLTNTTNYDEALFSFARWNKEEKLIVVSNFSADKNHQLKLQIPSELITEWQLADGHYQLAGVLSGDIHEVVIEDGKAGIEIELAPLESEIIRFTTQ